jgi:hypothetical protein
MSLLQTVIQLANSKDLNMRNGLHWENQVFCILSEGKMSDIVRKKDPQGRTAFEKANQYGSSSSSPKIEKAYNYLKLLLNASRSDWVAAFEKDNQNAEDPYKLWEYFQSERKRKAKRDATRMKTNINQIHFSGPKEAIKKINLLNSNLLSLGCDRISDEELIDMMRTRFRESFSQKISYNEDQQITESNSLSELYKNLCTSLITEQERRDQARQPEATVYHAKFEEARPSKRRRQDSRINSSCDHSECARLTNCRRVDKNGNAKPLCKHCEKWHYPNDDGPCDVVVPCSICGQLPGHRPWRCPQRRGYGGRGYGRGGQAGRGRGRGQGKGRWGKPTPSCQICGDPHHTAKHCPVYKKVVANSTCSTASSPRKKRARATITQDSASEEEEVNSFHITKSYSLIKSNHHHSFLIDTGSEEHITNDISHMTNIRDKITLIYGVNGDTPVKTKKIGDIKFNIHLNGKQYNFIIKDVIYMKECKSNIISTDRLNLDHSTKNNLIFLKDKYTREVILRGKKRHRLYFLEHKGIIKDIKTSLPVTISKKTDLLTLWHKRLGHYNVRDIVKTYNKQCP